MHFCPSVRLPLCPFKEKLRWLHWLAKYVINHLTLWFTYSEYILTLLSLLVKFNLIKNRKLYICCGTYRALITEYNHFHTPAYRTMQKTCLKKQNNAVIHWQFSFKREHSDVLITLYTHIPFTTPPNPRAEPRRVPYLSSFSPLNHLTILLLKKHLSEWNQITV